MDKKFLTTIKFIAIILAVVFIIFVFCNPLFFLQDGDFLRVYSIMFIKTTCVIVMAVMLFLFGLFYKNSCDKK